MLRKILYKLFLDRKNPKYFSFLYWFCKSYVDLYNGDGDADRETNGGWKWLKEYCKTNPKIIFDVGAYDGEYSKKIHEFNPNIKIYAFEPNLETFKKLKTGCRGRNIIFEQLALSDFEGDGILYSSKGGEAADSLHQRNKGRWPHNKFYKVKITTIDKYCEDNGIEYIDFLKIDTEGNDLNVIKGSEQMLKTRKIGIIQFEFSWHYTFSHIYLNDFYDYLSNFGFELYKIKHYGLEKVDDPIMERTIYAYFVAKKH